MPEIKNTFTQGKMNKDLDERIVPNGQYRDALNIQVSTSEGTDVGTVQNILGNTLVNPGQFLSMNSDFECIGSIADERNDTLYYFITDVESNIVDAIIQYEKGSGAATPVLVDTKAGTSDAVLKFSSIVKTVNGSTVQGLITAINIIDDMLLWTDGVNEPRKINITNCIAGSTSYLANHTQLNINDTNLVDIAEEHITVIKKKPLRPLSVKINPADASNKKPLFEKIFPRFSYRYRYEDGEYSAFAPFTEVVFNSEYSYDQNGVDYYDQNTAYDTKEPYNSGMRNMIDSIELSDFISPDIPKDVIQIDLLYKQENSNVIYLIDIVKDGDAGWIQSGSNALSNYTGKFIVNDENIYAALPENQLLRPWDNVPKTALAQEVTGNRVVYGNYTQSYDVDDSPTINSNYELRYNSSQDFHENYTWGPNLLNNSDFSSQPSGSSDWTVGGNGINIAYSNGQLEWTAVNAPTAIRQDYYDFEVGGRYKIIFNVSELNGNMSGKLLLRLVDGSSNHITIEDYTPILGENVLEVTLPSTPNNLAYGYTSPHSTVTNKFRLAAAFLNPFTGVIDDVQIQKGTKKDYKTFSDGGFKSVKSQRNYKLGVVYGDEYGRETPVFTSTESSVVIPWRDTSLSNTPLASRSLRLSASLDSPHPNWANYYKFFVKETSGEYYNLVMDAMYNPTKEDLEKDEHVWLSFSSSDRNKLSKEDYIILKKKVVPGTSSASLQIEEENKFKILDVKNEAPDAIKYKYLKVGEVANDSGSSSGILNAPYSSASGLFHDQDHRPLHPASNNATGGGSYPSGNTIWINKQVWSSIGGGRLVEGDDTNTGNQKVLENLYFSFTRTDANGNNQSSQKKYKIVSAEVEGAVSPYYIIKLSRSITKDDNNLIKADPTDKNNRNLHKDVIVKIEKKLSKDLESFSGRFFVKILSNNLIKSELESISLLDVTRNYLTEVTAEAFWHTDTITSGTYDIDAGLINNNGFDGVPGSNNVSSITSLSAGVTNTEGAWEALLTSMGSKRWFVDNMYMVAEQTGEYARHATYGWNGGNTNVTGDIHASTSTPSGYNQVGTLIGSYPLMQYPTDEIKPQNPTNNTDGDNLINGLEGVVTTTSMHISADVNVGLRRWKDIGWNGSGTASVLSNVYHNIGKHVIHISFLAPGEDLHDGEFQGGSVSDTNLDLWRHASGTNANSDYIHNNLQGIFGGGVFTSGTGAWYHSPLSTAPSGDPKHVFMELSGGNPNAVLVSSNYNVRGYGFGTDQSIHENKHNTQWDLPQADQAFANNLQVGKQFRFKDDSDGTVYTIKRSNYSNPKKIYNHTPWRKTWKMDGSNLVGMGNSVEEAATAWADGTDLSDGDNNAAGAQALRDKLEEFGKANNRRLVYILELDKDPTQQTYNPVSGGTDMDSITPDTIEFVTEDLELNAGEVSQNPAIWETEPKDSVDLDIYYEASQAYPTEINIENIELFAPIGSTVSLYGVTEEAIPSGATIRVGAWNKWDSNHVNYNSNYSGDLAVSFDNPMTIVDGSGNPINFIGRQIRFHQPNGGFTTLTITYAVGNIYPDVNFLVLKTDDNQSQSHGLGWYNCFSFGNGVESDRIRDDFNGMTLTNGVRANATLDKPYKEERRKSGLIYSGIYNSRNGVNNLNQFIMAEKITKDLNPTFGSIQKLFSRRISLIAFCEDRVVSITANKNALYNADGNPQLVATNAVLGDANPFVGDYGISQNPESFAKESYRAYFTDRQRGAVLRLSMDGLTPISESGMSDWFKDEFKDTSHYNIIGSYDNYKNNYNLTFDRSYKTYGIQSKSSGGEGGGGGASGSQTVSFSEDVKGWTSFKSFIPESGVSMSGDYYTFYEGRCWKHHDNESRNNFYGIANLGSSIKFLLNESPLAVKNYNTLNYDGDESWSCNSIETDQQEGSVQSFIEKEGKWFNYISGNEGVVDAKAFNFQGIGIANGIDYNI